MKSLAKGVAVTLLILSASACIHVGILEPVCHGGDERWYRLVSVTFGLQKAATRGVVVRGQVAFQVPNSWSGESTESQSPTGGPLIYNNAQIVWFSSSAAATKAEATRPASPNFKWVGFETNDLVLSGSPVTLELKQGVAFANMPGQAPGSLVYFASDTIDPSGTVGVLPWTCPASIPAISRLGMAALAALLATAGFFGVKRRRRNLQTPASSF